MNAHDLVTGNLRLTTLPDVYLKVKAVVDDPDAGVADMVQAIEHDPGITARLLRIANSAFFGFAAKVETVSRAVSLLGTQQIHDLVLATSLAGVPCVACMSKVTLNVGRICWLKHSAGELTRKQTISPESMDVVFGFLGKGLDRKLY